MSRSICNLVPAERRCTLPSVLIDLKNFHHLTGTTKVFKFCVVLLWVSVVRLPLFICPINELRITCNKCSHETLN